MQKAAKENIFVVCAIVLCFMVTIGLCTFYSGEGILGVFSMSKEAGTTVYAVVVGGYSDMTLARTTSDLIKQRGGAGYVIKGDTIEIVYAAYRDEDSANKVLTGLGEHSAYIKTIEIGESKLKWADGEVKNATKNALRYYGIAFDSLYNTANALYDGSVSVENARTQLSVLKSQIEDIKTEYYQSTAGQNAEEITEVKLALITALALLDNVKPAGTTAEFVSSLRYALVQLVMCRASLMSQI